jgi:TRAP-type uncharacterized transport system fused permease subunit
MLLFVKPLYKSSLKFYAIFTLILIILLLYSFGHDQSGWGVVMLIIYIIAMPLALGMQLLADRRTAREAKNLPVGAKDPHWKRNMIIFGVLAFLGIIYGIIHSTLQTTHLAEVLVLRYN